MASNAFSLVFLADRALPASISLHNSRVREPDSSGHARAASSSRGQLSGFRQGVSRLGGRHTLKCHPSTLLLLETRAGRELPPVDPCELPWLWISERAEHRAADLQLQRRAAHQHLGVPPPDYLIAAVAEDHRASILHYDADFGRLAAITDLAATVDALVPLGSLP